ncbi:MAG: hypothetical protein NUK65_07415, partial [Firmicutes bacterium]|nr:hypothetical protein [Bacillota bacterium]
QDDGIVVKLKNRKFTIGDVVTMNEKTLRRKGRFSAMMATAAMFLLLMGAGAWAYATPYYFVSVDVNPSILMEVNLFGRVIEMAAVNEDAVRVIEGLNVRNKHVEDAISDTVARLAEAGYLEGEGRGILIASTAKNNEKAERLAGKLKEAIEEEIADNGIKSEVASGSVGYDMVQDAKEWEISPGKYNIITNLLGEEITEANVADYQDKSVKDLMAVFTAGKGVDGKAKANEATTKTPNELGEAAEQARLRERNSQVASENRSEVPEVPEVPELPEVVELPELPEVPVGKKP